MNPSPKYTCDGEGMREQLGGGICFCLMLLYTVIFGIDLAIKQIMFQVESHAK